MWRCKDKDGGCLHLSSNYVWRNRTKRQKNPQKPNLHSYETSSSPKQQSADDMDKTAPRKLESKTSQRPLLSFICINKSGWNISSVQWLELNLWLEFAVGLCLFLVRNGQHPAGWWHGVGMFCFSWNNAASVDRHPWNLLWSGRELQDATPWKALPKRPPCRKKPQEMKENQGKPPPALPQLFSFNKRRKRTRARRRDSGAWTTSTLKQNSTPLQLFPAAGS